jgi:hypothetical protein
MKNKKQVMMSTAETFMPYAVALSSNESALSVFGVHHPALDRSTLEPLAFKIASELVHQVRLNTSDIDVKCHLFRPNSLKALAFELDLVPEIDCFIVKSESDEALAQRYLSAIRAIRRTQGNVQRTLYFTKPSKRLLKTCPQAAADLADTCTEISICASSMGDQHKALWRALTLRLRPLSLFKPFLSASTVAP